MTGCSLPGKCHIGSGSATSTLSARWSTNRSRASVNASASYPCIGLAGLGSKRIIFDLMPNGLRRRHGAEITDIPANAEILAKSDVCPVQAFRVGQHAYGFQCHVDDTVGQWAAVPAYASSLESAMGQGAVTRLQTEVTHRLPQFNQDARTLYQSFKAALKSR
jgi:hypothetical protein